MTSSEVAEYMDLYRTAMSRIARDRKVIDKDRCARSMVEAYYRGRYDRERIDREMAK